MGRRVSTTAEQLELIGIDQGCLEQVGVTPELAARLRERWSGARVPCAGEAQLRCRRCGLGASVRFRCAGRCDRECEHGARAASAMLRVIPRVPVRHWVLTLPGVLRAASAVDQRLVTEIGRGFLSHVFAFVRERVPQARAESGCGPVQCGGISLVHRTARALTLDLHIHALVLDGGYVAGDRGGRVFVPMPDEPTIDELAALTARLREHLLTRWRKRRASAEGESLWRLGLEHSVVAGPVAATAVRRIRIDGVGPGRSRRVGAGARRDGFGVHVMERIDGNARGALASLARYLVRAPVALAELRAGGAGQSHGHSGEVVHRLSRPFADGSTHVAFSTDELARRLVALTPAGVVHRVSYHGALAPGALAKWRARPLQLALVDSVRVVGAGTRRRRERAEFPAPPCSRCGGAMGVVGIDESVDSTPFAPAAHG